MTPDTLVTQGRKLLDKGEFRQALLSFEQAKDLSDKHYEALAYSGFTLLVLGRYDDALRDFQSALPLNPSNPDLHNYIARCWMSLGDEEKALTHFHKSASLRAQTALNSEDALTIPAFRFKHDMEQLIALETKRALDEEAQSTLAAFKRVWSDVDETQKLVSVPCPSSDYLGQRGLIN